MSEPEHLKRPLVYEKTGVAPGGSTGSGDLHVIRELGVDLAGILCIKVVFAANRAI